MKNNIRFSQLLLVFILLMGMGCQTSLQEGGVYKGDEVLYNADRVITQSYRVLHSFVKWEYDFRATLPPEVSRAADTVRANAEKWINSAHALRDAYVANPSGENRTNLEKALSILERALAEAARYMSEHEPNRRVMTPP